MFTCFSSEWYLSLVIQVFLNRVIPSVSSGILRAAGEDDRHAAEGEVGRPADRSADPGSETC